MQNSMPESTLRTMYRVIAKIDLETWDHLMQLNADRDLENDPFTLSKLEATGFLNAPMAIKKTALSMIAEGKLVSQKAVDEFCINEALEKEVESVAAKRELQDEELEEVCTLVVCRVVVQSSVPFESFKWYTILNCTIGTPFLGQHFILFPYGFAAEATILSREKCQQGAEGA